jgi:hypothetical protein
VAPIAGAFLAGQQHPKVLDTESGERRVLDRAVEMFRGEHQYRGDRQRTDGSLSGPLRYAYGPGNIPDEHMQLAGG